MSWFRVPEHTAARLRRRWERLFRRQRPYAWEVREAAYLLYKVSQSARACQMLADQLEIECDPGESVADFVSQQLREPMVERAKHAHLGDLKELTEGFSDV